MRKLINIKNINASYVTSKGVINAVNDVSLEIKEGEMLGIVGESGCGKTTLMKIIYGFIEPPLKVIQGRVIFNIEEDNLNNVDILSLSREDLRKKIWWRYISWIPQGAQNVLNPTTKIYGIFVETIKRFTNMDEKEMLKFVKDYVLKFNLPEDILTAYPDQLSGGMKQRVIIALATILKPKVILADEPTSALDVVTQKVILRMLRDICDEYGVSIILVSHDIDVIGVVCDRTAVMYAGNIVEVSETDSLFKEPLHPYTKALIESLPRLGDKSVKKGLKGQPPDLANPPSGCRFHPRCIYARDMCKKKKPPLIEVKSGRSVACWLYSDNWGDDKCIYMK